MYRLVISFIYDSYDNKMLEKVLGSGDAEEEMVNAFHISLNRNDLWLTYEKCDTCILPKFTHLVKFYQTSPVVHKVAWYNETKILLLCPNIRFHSLYTCM